MPSSMWRADERPTAASHPPEDTVSALPWSPMRGRTLATSSVVQVGLFVAAPVLVAVAAVCLLVHIQRSTSDFMAQGELVGRLRSATATLSAAMNDVAEGGPGAGRIAPGDVERFDRVITEVSALEMRSEWRGRRGTDAGVQHLQQLQNDWPLVREAIALPRDAGTSDAARRVAAETLRSFPLHAGELAGDLESFFRDEQAQHDRFLSMLLGSLVAALVVGALLRMVDLGRIARHQAELSRLSLVAESTGSSVALADAQGRATWANDAFLRTTGWETVAGRELSQLLCDGPGTRARQELADAFARHQPHHEEYELRREDGRAFWASVELMPLAETGPGAPQYMVMFTDVTPRITATRALADSEGRFRSALASMSEGFILHDADGTIVQCNAAASRILGVPEQVLVGERISGPPQGWMDADGRRMPNEEFPVARSLRTGQPEIGVVVGMVHPAGETVWLSISTSPFTLPGGRPPGVVVTFTDITARRKAEQSVQSLSQVVAESPTMVLLTDADNRIEYVNRAFEVCTGFGMDDVRGRPPSFMLSDLTPQATWDSLGQALGDGGYWRGEIHNTARDGSVWLSDSQVFALRTTGGTITHFVALMRDITEQRRRESELAAAREAALAAARAKSEFLQNVSHELRTPLNGIMGMTELLLGTPLDTGQRADLLQLRRSADDLLTVVTHLFDFVRAESATGEAPATPFRLRGSLAEIERALAEDAESHGLSWSVNVESSVPEDVVGDPGKLRRVLLNLVANAVKFTERGEVTLRVSPVVIADARMTLHFEVRDTGIGIPRERQAEIFEAFSQVDGSSTRRYGGIGLGLALASRLVRQMGGQLRVTSEAGQGSTFAFDLELARADTAAVAPAAPRTAGHGDAPFTGARILFVSGPGPERAGAREALARRGARVDVALGADEAAAMLATASGDSVKRAIVVDQRDGRLDAFAVHAELKDAIGTLPPVLVVTTAGQRGDADRCRAAGIDGYLASPAGDAEIVDALRRMLAPPANAAPALVTQHLLREEHRRRRVLLVDDNAVNRKVAARLLDRAGFEVTCAVDGHDAIEHFVAADWDAVLMDVQMPEMDGLEAARRIRELERERGEGRTPVLALTAHTLDTDRRAVLAAGMDDLVPKPIQPDELVGALQRHLGAGPAPGETPVAPTPLGQVLDRAEALERMDGDEALLDRLLLIFKADAGAMLKRLDDAAAGGDAHQLERAAHALKGASATISASHVSELALSVETLAREGRLTEARDQLEDLRREFRRLVHALENVQDREAA